MVNMKNEISELIAAFQGFVRRITSAVDRLKLCF